MGRLEAENKKRVRRANLQKIILSTVATAGVLSIATVAPNALVSMKKLGLAPSKRRIEFIAASRKRLVQQGFLAYKDTLLYITPKGEKRLRQLQMSEYALQKPKRWDKKWRVLIFDIPEKRKGLRDKVRRTLVQIGFKRLQDSVWVYPYDCEDLLVLLKADFKIGKALLYMIVDSIEYDSPLRAHFFPQSHNA